VNLN
jgi:hypothetical protein